MVKINENTILMDIKEYNLILEKLEEAEVKIRNQIEELKKSNEMLRKALMETTKKNKNNRSDVKVSRKDFLKMHSEAVNFMLDNYDAEENDVYGYNITVHWHGMYCSCGDGATPSNYLIPSIEECDDELDFDE